MKRILMLMACALIVVFAASSCQTGYSKSTFFSALERFVTNVEEDWKTYSEDDWERADARMEAFEEKYEKYMNELSREEDKKVSQLMRRYSWLRLKGGAKGLLEDLSDVYEEGKTVVEEAYEGLEKVGETIGDYADSLSSFFK